MKTFARAVFGYLLALPDIITPGFIMRRADAETWSIERFMYTSVVPLVRSTDRVLDAGAGTMRFKPALSFARYESTDFPDVFHKEAQGKHDFVCSLEDIPKEDNTYDVIINTQVMEHIEHPQKVMHELFRILKPGGKLFLTTNQMWAVHGAPYNFYFYSRYGLESLFRQAGFDIITIEARGGAFRFLAKFLHTLPGYIYFQLAYTGYKKHVGFMPTLRSPLLAVLLLPFYVLIQFLAGNLLPYLLFYLDRLDRQKDFTLGYACHVKKPG